MTDWTRREFVSGISLGAAHLLLSRTIHAAEVVAPAQGIPAIGNEHLLTLVAVSPNILRLRVVQQGKQGPAAEIGIVSRDWPEPLQESSPGLITWGSFTIHTQQNPWRIAIVDSAGKTRQQIRLEPSTGAVHFGLGEGPLFGLGEGGHPLNRRGTTDAMRNGQSRPDLATFGARVPIPWILGSSKGSGCWGIFFAHPWGSFDLSADEGQFLPVDSTPTRDIFLVLAQTPAELLENWADLTGYPHMPPLWAFGFHQSHRTLESRESVLDELKQFRDRKLPCDAMIYLGTGFCPSGWNTGHGSFTFNPTVFPDPAAIIRQMHDEHFKIALHVTSPPEDLHGDVADAGATAHDPSDAAAYWRTHLDAQNMGVDGWWPDEGDELPPASRLARNRMYWEGPQLAAPNVRPFALHRNGYAGLQRFGWLWSGDTLSTWKTLAAQVMVGINTGLCGIPYWGTDTGGFVPTKEFTAELFVRWFQFSSFCPSFRCHGRTWKLRLPWGWSLGNYGPAEFDSQFADDPLPKPADLHNPLVEEICRKFLDLRYSLLTYLYSNVAQTHATGLPLMRSLWLGYPDDPNAAACDDAYLWGNSILVAPVLEPGATHRTTYLPRGLWWDFWTNDRIEGGREVTRETTLDSLPLFVKAGSVLPVGPVKQHTGEESTEPLKLRVYPGASGAFSLYEDDGTTFNYQHKQFTRIDCAWNDAERTLTVKADPLGQLPDQRILTVELVGTRERRQIIVSGAAPSVSDWSKLS